MIYIDKKYCCDKIRISKKYVLPTERRRRKAMGKKPQLSDFTLREKIGQTCQMQSGFLMNMGDEMLEGLT